MEVLREAVTATATLIIEGGQRVTREVEVRPALMASQCASCAKHFRMNTTNGNKSAGAWHARMSGCPGRQGNDLFLACCSFECAANLEAGGWKKPKAEKHVQKNATEYVDEGFGALFAEFQSGHAIYEEELVARWEGLPLLTAADFEVGERPRHRRQPLL